MTRMTGETGLTGPGQADETGAPVLSIRGLRAGYGRDAVLDGIDLPAIRPNQVTVFAGPNGAGKSTLLKALAGLVPARGEVVWGRHDLLALGARARAAHLGFMPQAIPGTDGLTVLESVIASARALAPGPARGIEERALDTLAQVGVLAHAMTPLGRLSGGQRQLAGLAQSLVRDPAILLLDEPTSALDLRHQVEVMAVMRRVAARGRIVIAVLHDLGLAANWADAMVLLHGGRVAGTGRPDAVLTPERLHAVYGVRARLERGAEGEALLAVGGRA